MRTWSALIVMDLFFAATMMDLSRVMIMLGLDIAALMGYTRALFLKFFGSLTGIAISVFSLLCWIAIPSFLMVRIANKKDF